MSKSQPLLEEIPKPKTSSVNSTYRKRSMSSPRQPLLSEGDQKQKQRNSPSLASSVNVGTYDHCPGPTTIVHLDPPDSASPLSPNLTLPASYAGAVAGAATLPPNASHSSLNTPSPSPPLPHDPNAVGLVPVHAVSEPSVLQAANQHYHVGTLATELVRELNATEYSSTNVAVGGAADGARVNGAADAMMGGGRASLQNTQIRTLGEIKSFLEHFVPQIKFRSALFSFFIRPISIALNILFILYNVARAYSPVSGNVESTYSHRLGLQYFATIVAYLELIGLIAIGCTSFYMFSHKKNYAGWIDCIRLMGNWSGFYLFYVLRPRALWEYCSAIYRDCELGQAQTSPHVAANSISMVDIDENRTRNVNDDSWIYNKNVGLLDAKTLRRKIKYLKQELTVEMDILERYRRQVLYHQLSDATKKSVPMEPVSTARAENIHRHIQALGHLLNRNSDVLMADMSVDQHNIIMESLQAEQALQHSFKCWWRPLSDVATSFWGDSLATHATYCVSWAILILLFVGGLALGTLALMLKLSQLSFVGDQDVTTWSFYPDWIFFVAFANQVLNIDHAARIELDAIYTFLFSPKNAYGVDKIADVKKNAVDTVIKNELWLSHGWHGFMLALNFNGALLHEIVVKNECDIPIMDCVAIRDWKSHSGSVDKASITTEDMEIKRALKRGNLAEQGVQKCKQRCARFRDRLTGKDKHVPMDLLPCAQNIVHHCRVKAYQRARAERECKENSSELDEGKEEITGGPDDLKWSGSRDNFIVLLQGNSTQVTSFTAVRHYEAVLMKSAAQLADIVEETQQPFLAIHQSLNETLQNFFHLMVGFISRHAQRFIGLLVAIICLFSFLTSIWLYCSHSNNDHSLVQSKRNSPKCYTLHICALYTAVYTLVLFIFMVSRRVRYCIQSRPVLIVVLIAAGEPIIIWLFFFGIAAFTPCVTDNDLSDGLHTVVTIYYILVALLSAMLILSHFVFFITFPAAVLVAIYVILVAFWLLSLIAQLCASALYIVSMKTGFAPFYDSNDFDSNSWVPQIVFYTNCVIVASYCFSVIFGHLVGSSNISLCRQRSQHYFVTNFARLFFVLTFVHSVWLILFSYAWNDDENYLEQIGARETCAIGLFFCVVSVIIWVFNTSGFRILLRICFGLK